MRIARKKIVWKKHNTIQYNTIQYYTTQHNTTQHNTTQKNRTEKNFNGQVSFLSLPLSLTSSLSFPLSLSISLSLSVYLSQHFYFQLSSFILFEHYVYIPFSKVPTTSFAIYCLRINFATYRSTSPFFLI